MMEPSFSDVRSKDKTHICHGLEIVYVPSNTTSYWIFEFDSGCKVFRLASWCDDLEIMFDFPNTISYQEVVDIVKLNVDEGIFV